MPELLITASAYGCRVGLRVPSVQIDAVRGWLPHWWVDADVEPQRVWPLPSVHDAESAIGDLELWVAEHAAGLIFVHAGAVAFDGRAVLLPGRSLTGKSTLTAALLRAGGSYGSDEYAVLAPDGTVLPYPRPLAIRGPGGRARVPAAEFGASTFTGPLPVAAVAAVRYVAGASFVPRPISTGTAVLRLFDNTVAAQSRPEEALDALIAATRHARAVEGERGEADDAVAGLRALLANAPAG